MHDLVPGTLDSQTLDIVTGFHRPDIQLAAIRALLGSIDARQWIADAIENLTADPQALQAAAAHTIEHPNGFDRLTLVDALPHYRIRLHIWWPERRGAVEDIHNHAWDFGSVVLAGQLRFKTYTAGETGEEHFVYRHTYGAAGNYRDDEVERCRLVLGLNAVLPAGTQYTFDHRQLHTVSPEGEGPVATLVVTGRLLRDGSDVFVKKARNEDGFRQPTTVISADDLRVRLLRLAPHLT
jgi:hypothetical protein